MEERKGKLIAERGERERERNTASDGNSGIYVS